VPPNTIFVKTYIYAGQEPLHSILLI